ADGAIDTYSAFWRFLEDETVYYATDGMVWSLARTLAALSPPLVQLSEPADPSRAVPKVTVTMTGEGRAVLDGRADRIALCGVDTWRGGVHLTGRGPLWRWSADERRLVFA